jgi:hypothetical protein
MIHGEDGRDSRRISYPLSRYLKFRIARRGAERFDLSRVETSPASASRTADPVVKCTIREEDRCG